MALQPKSGDVVVQAQKLDIASVAFHVGTNLVKRLEEPRLERNRMQVVDKEQTAHRAIVDQAS